MRKPVFGVSDQVRHKPVCTATGDEKRLESSDFNFRYKLIEGLYDPLCENKGADQLRSSLFSHMQKAVFSQRGMKEETSKRCIHLSKTLKML